MAYPLTHDGLIIPSDIVVKRMLTPSKLPEGFLLSEETGDQKLLTEFIENDIVFIAEGRSPNFSIDTQKPTQNSDEHHKS